MDLKPDLLILTIPSPFGSWRLYSESTFLNCDRRCKKQLREPWIPVWVMGNRSWMVCMHQINNNPCHWRFQGWKRISAFHFAEEMSLRVNCLVIFGENLGKFQIQYLFLLANPGSNVGSKESGVCSGCTTISSTSSRRYAYCPLSTELDWQVRIPTPNDVALLISADIPFLGWWHWAVQWKSLIRCWRQKLSSGCETCKVVKRKFQFVTSRTEINQRLKVCWLVFRETVLHGSSRHPLLKSNRPSNDLSSKSLQSFLHPHINYQLYVIHQPNRRNKGRI